MQKDKALIIGRFQPFHTGHLNVIKYIASKHDTIIIGIGSAQYSHTVENPFTAGERHMMISRSLEAEGIKNYYLVPIEDVNRYDVWVSHIAAIVPKFDVVYTNNPLTRQLFLERGYKVRSMPVYNRKKYSGKEIRKRIISNGDWKPLVPEQVAEVIKEIDGVERLKTLAGTDAYIPEANLARELIERNLKIAVAESCTGGLLSHVLTNVPDASRFFSGGIVAYSEDMKIDLGVPKQIVEKYGTIGERTTIEMAKHIRQKTRSDIGIGITGYTGPEAGWVHIAVSGKREMLRRTFNLTGSREEIKEKAVAEALKMISEFVRTGVEDKVEGRRR